MSATLNQNKHDRILYIPVQFRDYEKHALLDNGAKKSAMSESEISRILTYQPSALLQEMPATEYKTQFTNGNIVPMINQVQLRFFLAGKIFEETFIVLPTMGNILIGMYFFDEYSVTLDLRTNRVRFPDLSLQLKPDYGKFKGEAFELKLLQKVVVGRFQQVMVPTITATELDTSLGITEATLVFIRKSDLIVTPKMIELRDGRTTIQVKNNIAHTLTIGHGAVVANFKVLRPGQVNQVQPMSLEQQLTLVSSLPEESQQPHQPTLPDSIFIGGQTMVPNA